jgi:hypothetical protein
MYSFQNFLTQVQRPDVTQKRKTPQTLLSEGYRLVRLAGIEPTTPWFVAKYSIQLSYSRIKTDIMPWKLKTT